MILEVDSKSPEELIYAIARSIKAEVKDGTMQIPSVYGSGYIKSISISNGPTILIRQYELKEELKISSKAGEQSAQGVVISFHNIYQHKDTPKNQTRLLPFAQIESAVEDYQELFQSKTHFNTIIIIISISQLQALIQQKGNQNTIQRLLWKNKPFIFEELLSPEMQDVANQILNKVIPDDLKALFYRIKAEELIYHLFAELNRRNNLSVYPANIEDMKKVYSIRDEIIDDLCVKPNLMRLAQSYGMSESKLKRLFKQIFGTSVYDYYLRFRMEHAVILLVEKKHSVAEVGYILGFTNLSHFAKLFARHKGLNPKKYAKVHQQK
ncbi:helix-turn-helix transcriptional regulator [Agrobacterium tumefaciens]|nr:helix-turn-helix transcriptional regulator [Agrobacterium tumefaciens]NTE22248.1 helix-turn-helix transcriptional regulator [Agrobacterium tumefaciens]